MTNENKSTLPEADTLVTLDENEVKEIAGGTAEVAFATLSVREATLATDSRQSIVSDVQIKPLDEETISDLRDRLRLPEGSGELAEGDTKGYVVF